MKHFSHLNSAAAILQLYRGEPPFHHFIKDYFRQHKKFGSSDRKRISRLCYAYFRLGRSYRQLAMEERILLGLFLCADAPDELLAQLRPDWNAAVQQPLPDKCALAGVVYDALDIFPFPAALSETIEQEAFALSHLRQPRLFLRLRPGHEQMVTKKLDGVGIAWKRMGDACLSLPNTAPVDGLLELDKEAVVQDYSSQRVGDFLCLARDSAGGPVSEVWDCCAASGGKSILARDVLGNVRLTVSDVRSSILANLEKRFAAAGITGYRNRVANLAVSAMPGTESYDLIMADVPCSGSGTWGRTPEALSFFTEEGIDRYQALQKQIITNAAPRLKKGGCLLYITCSVFKKENEDLVRHIQEKAGLQLVQASVLAGYTLQADTMFAALFVRPAS